MGVLALDHMIAWALRPGIELQQQVSERVIFLMKKIMQVLGFRLFSTSVELTHVLIRFVLMRLVAKINEEGRKAQLKIG